MVDYRKDNYFGPFGGIVDDVPRPYKQPGDFDDLINWFVFEGRLRTRPRLNAFGRVPDSANVRAIVPYTDVQNFTHMLVLSNNNPYAVTAGPVFNLLTMPVGLSLATFSTGLPFGTQIMNGQVFFSNGSTDVVYANGSAAIKATVDVPGAARFMCVLASHLLLANTTEPRPGVAGSTRFLQRVRWSASGDPTTWTGTPSAGFNDLLDVPDEITGLVTLGQNAYVFRSNGITVISPTGPPNAPFLFYNQSVGVEGIGNAFPYSLASFGAFCAFVSEDDVYIFDGVNFTPIGGSARKKIFKDLSENNSDQVVGFIVPQLGLDYPYLSYWLSIPGSLGNITWVYSRTSGKWQRFQPGPASTFMTALAVGQTS